MATITAANGFVLNMDPNSPAFDLGALTGIQTSPTLIRGTYANSEEWFFGSFAYAANGALTGGIFTEYRLYLNGVLSLHIADGLINVADVASGTVLDAAVLGGNDAITGSTSGDYLLGYGGNDTLTGNEGGDTLDGGTGNDLLLGGAGNDILFGGQGNDSLWGGTGADRFRIKGASDGQDVIKDFNQTDDVIGLSGFGTSASSSGLSLAAGHVTFQTGTNASTTDTTLLYDRQTGRIMWDADGTGSSQKVVLATATMDPTGVALDSSWGMAGRGDFNADGTDDILWRNGQGDLLIWQMQNNARVNGLGFGNADNSWTLADVVDFTGDGTDDLLWRNDASGESLIWQMGNYGKVNGYGLGTIDPSWKVAGGGDFNNDGKADIIWSNRISNEALIWTMDGAQKLGGAGLGEIDGSWTLAGSGDFNNDGTDDLLWHNRSGEVLVWDMANGAKLGGHLVGAVDRQWQVVSTVDTNADGTSDIVWHHSQTGEVLTWQMLNGAKTNGFLATVANPEWSVVDSGDFNNDGIADLVWRSQNERMAIMAYDQWNQLNMNASDFLLVV